MENTQESVFDLYRVPRVFLRLSFFSLAATLATSVYSLTDAYFVGTIGTDAIAGVSVVFPLVALLGGLGLALGTGTSSWVARLLGAGDYDRAGSYASSGLVSGLVLMLPLTVTLVATSPTLIGVMGATGPLSDHAVQYARVAIPAAALTALNMIAGSLMRSEGSAGTATLGLVIGAVLNVVLDPLLIAPFGVAGAAWATLVAQVATLVFYTLLYRWRQRVIVLRPPLRWNDGRGYRSILSLGLPALLAQLGLAIVILVLNKTALRFGAASLAAAGVSVRVASAGIFVVLALCRGLHPMIGYYQGANNRADLRSSLWVGSLTIGGFAVVFAAGVAAAAGAIMSGLTGDSGVVRVGEPLLVSFVIFFPLFAAQLILATYWQASGILWRSVMVSVARPGLFLLPALLLLPRLLGFRGLLLATPLSDLLSGLGALGLLWFGRKRWVRTPA